MFVRIDILLKMTGETVVDPKNYFLNMGLRVFDDDDGAFYLMKNAAILYVDHSYDRVQRVTEYKPQNEYESRVQTVLLGPADDGFEVLTEVYK